MTTLPQLRRDLVLAKSNLRIAKTDLETAKTVATLNTTGSNDRERKKADDQALLDSPIYQNACMLVRASEFAVDNIETEIDILKDERTARELTIKERNNEVLDRLAAAYERMAETHPVAASIGAQLLP